MPPFFSGAGVSELSGLPLIAISDPSLALSKETSLGWYAGHTGFEDLPKVLSKLLDFVALVFKVDLILAGGSGGGFAALNVGRNMVSKPSVLVWGPQTSISSYSKWAVHNYLYNSFSRCGAEEKDLYAALESHGLLHDVRDVDLDCFSFLLYLQNITDSHTKKHAGPFLYKKNISQISRSIFSISESQRHFIVFGDWGKGHIPPPKSIIVECIKHISHSLSTDDVSVPPVLSDLASSSSPILSSDNLACFELTCCIDRGRLVGSVRCAIHNFPYLRVSFYAIIDGVVVEKLPYSNKFDFSFSDGLDIKVCDSVVVCAFLKDVAGNVQKIKRIVR